MHHTVSLAMGDVAWDYDNIVFPNNLPPHVYSNPEEAKG